MSHNEIIAALNRIAAHHGLRKEAAIRRGAIRRASAFNEREIAVADAADELAERLRRIEVAKAATTPDEHQGGSNKTLSDQVNRQEKTP